MRRQAAIVIALILGVSVLAAALYRMGARKADERESLRPVLPSGVEVALDGATRITSSEDGKVTWTMTCDGLLFYKDSGLVEVLSPRAWVPAQDGGTVVVEGNFGNYFQKSRDILLNGDVEIVSMRGDTVEWMLDGDTASYKHKSETFFVSGLEGLMYEGGDTVHVKGRRGSYESRARVMRISGDVDLALDKGSRVEWVLNGERASFYQEEQVFNLEPIKGIYLQPDGGTLDLAANQGRFEAESDMMRLEGDVVLEWSDGITLLTPALDYHAATGVAETEERVKVLAKGWSLDGLGFWADTRAEKIVVKKDVNIKLEKGFSGLK